MWSKGNFLEIKIKLLFLSIICIVFHKIDIYFIMCFYTSNEVMLILTFKSLEIVILINLLGYNKSPFFRLIDKEEKSIKLQTLE